MKKALLLPLIVLLTACVYDEKPGILESNTGTEIMTFDSLKGAENFSFSMLEERDFLLEVRNHNNELYPNANFTLLNSDKQEIINASTNSFGTFQMDHQLVTSEEQLYLIVDALGVPQDTVELYADDLTSYINAPSSNSRRSRSSLGLPDELAEDIYISQVLIDDINTALPERSKVHLDHPEYIQQGAVTELITQDSSNVWVTFIHEGAGYRNTLGYFLYGINETPASIDELELLPIFPNASYYNSGGGLYTGNTVYLGKIPGDMKIGFFVIANGWNGYSIDWNRPIYTSIPDLNPESTPDMRKHLAILYHEEFEKAIIGFEDLNRDSDGCDHDFNDLVFTVQWDPIETINIEGMVAVPSNTDSDNDGVSDNNDHYPNDPLKAYNRYYPSQNSVAMLAYEDLYPATGDYDFNDLVIEYNIQEIVNADLEVVEISGTFTPKASGASKHNGFAISFGEIDLPSSYEVAIDGVSVSGSNVEMFVGGDVVATLFPDIKTLYNASESFINTVESDPKMTNPILSFSMTFDTPQQLDPAPYNPFIFRTGMEELEVHLPDHEPTSRFDITLFGTGADNSSVPAGRYFRTYAGLPWAVHLSKDWEHPQEGIDMLDAYDLFDEWVNADGREYRDWEVNGKNSNRIYSK